MITRTKMANVPDTSSRIWYVTGHVTVPNTLPAVVLVAMQNSTPASAMTPK